MPLSQNEDTNKLAGELVDLLRTLFGTPETSRPGMDLIEYHETH